MFPRQHRTLGHLEHCPEVSLLHVVPGTLEKSVTPAVEVVVHVPPMEVHPTCSTGIRSDVVLGLRSGVAPMSVGHSRDQPTYLLMRLAHLIMMKIWMLMLWPCWNTAWHLGLRFPLIPHLA